MIFANDFDNNAIQWLSKLPLRIDALDGRSIKEIKGNELHPYTQCHFFAGIGGWPLALELAGWPIDAPVWTGSCPCQPFSAAGKRKGTKDERHLWPEFRRLIDECRPSTIFGEQVASKDGRNWLASVRTDLEALGYAVGAADLCAAGIGAPHIRQRLFWVAYSDLHRCNKGREGVPEKKHDGAVGDRPSSGMANRGCPRLEEWQEQPARKECETFERSSDASRLAHSGRERSDPRGGSVRWMETREWCQLWLNNQSCCGVGNSYCERSSPQREIPARPGTQPPRSCWSDVEYIECRDGKARPVKPGIRLLAHGIPGRVAQLRGLGNAIVPQVAAEFVAAVMDSLGILRKHSPR